MFETQGYAQVVGVKIVELVHTSQSQGEV